MPTKRWLAPALLVIVAGCADLRACTDLLRGEAELLRGIRRRDPAALPRLLSADVRYHAPDGHPLDRAAWLAAVMATEGDIVSIVGERLRVEPHSQSWTVCGFQRSVVRLNGREVVEVSPFCDDFQKRDGRWQLVAAYVPTMTL